MNMLFGVLAAASLAATPALAATYNHMDGYAGPHPGYHASTWRSQSTYRQPHYAGHRAYTTRAYQPYTTTRTDRRYDNDRGHYDDRYRDHRFEGDRRFDRDRDDRFRHGGYYDGGYALYGPAVTYGYYGADYGDPTYEEAAPYDGYAYDQGYYAAPADEGYTDAGAYADGNGYYGAGAGYDADTYYDGGYGSAEAPASSPCGHWVWGGDQWNWAYCNCRSPRG